MRPLLLALSLLSSTAFAASVSLEGNTDSLEIVTSADGSIDYSISWSNVTATALTTPGTSVGNISTATTTTAVAAPAASNWRYLRSIHARNSSSTTANAVTMQRDRSATNYVLFSVTLAPGESLRFDDDGWTVSTASGGLRTQNDPPGYSGRSYTIGKVATALDAVGYHYLSNKDSGFPGAMTFGAPGLNGATLDCSTAGGAAVPGSHVLPNPASGGWYLTRFGLNAVVANTYGLVDLLWYNTGYSVTTTTAQNVTSPTWPARDINGSTNGDGLQIALYALTTVANAAAVANTTVSYTNSSGTAGRTATFSGAVGFQAPATAVIGTFMPFILAAGDTGVRSVQSVTLGTSYVSGTLSLLLYRGVALEGVSTTNFPSGSLLLRQAVNPGVRLWNGTCLGVAVYGGIATTAPSFTAGLVEIMER